MIEDHYFYVTLITQSRAGYHVEKVHLFTSLFYLFFFYQVVTTLFKTLHGFLLVKDERHTDWNRSICTHLHIQCKLPSHFLCISL